MSLLIICLILLFILFIPIGIGVKYENGTFVLVKISFLLFSVPLEKLLKLFTKKSNSTKKKDKSEKNELDKGIIGIDFILSLFGNFRRFIRKRFTLKDFSLKITFGTTDAASTAVLTGHLWSLSYNLLSLIDKLVYVEKPDVNITPVFNDATIKVYVTGIIKTRLAHIIATAIVFVYKLFKYKNNKSRRKTI